MVKHFPTILAHEENATTIDSPGSMRQAQHISSLNGHHVLAASTLTHSHLTQPVPFVIYYHNCHCCCFYCLPDSTKQALSFPCTATTWLNPTTSLLSACRYTRQQGRSSHDLFRPCSLQEQTCNIYTVHIISFCLRALLLSF